MDRLSALAAEWERAKTGAQEYLDAMPAAQFGFRPATGARTFAEQFLHVAATQYAFAAAATGRASPLDPAADPEQDAALQADRAALRGFVLASYDFAIGGVRALDPAALEEEVPFYRLRLPRALLLAKALEHHAHHRGQTAVYLRLAGVAPPSQRLF